MMRAVPGRPRLSTRLTRALGLDGNPLRRASDRAEAWIRVSLLAVFLIAGPIVAAAAGGWVHQAGAARSGPGRASVPPPESGQLAHEAVLAVIIALAIVAVALLAVLWLIKLFLNWRRLAAWEAAWSAIAPRWTGRRP